ncbi:MAG: hypothetical protein WCC63_07570, partial [Candidatus Bathyarchaeia archaeon]
MAKPLDMSRNHSLYNNLEELVRACCNSYHSVSQKSEDKPDVGQRRKSLAKWIQRFHEDCGTLTPRVKESLEYLRCNPCIFLMTAHQPNLFAYSGVLRKATLSHVLAERLSEELDLPAVSFFGLADQDFSDDRWVRCALLPDVERKDGVLEFRVSLPEKTMLCRIEKPLRKVLDDWLVEIQGWLERNLSIVERQHKGAQLSSAKRNLSKNLERFWSLVEAAYARAKTYSDFNEFVMSRIVNNAWDYPTLFARFSECQQSFGPEFETLLSRYDEYSKFVKEATSCLEEPLEGGVFKDESSTLPFWLNCDCGGKARLLAERAGGFLYGVGKCLKCEREYHVNFGKCGETDVSGVVEKISARSLAMPLIFFKSLEVCCYVGGEGGRGYMLQARNVAEKMFNGSTPVVVWRPHDLYRGVGQVAAFVTFSELSGKRNLSELDVALKNLRQKIAGIQHRVNELEAQKKQLTENA